MAAARAAFVTAIMAAALTVTFTGCADKSLQATSPSKATPSVTPTPPASSPGTPTPAATASSAAPPPTAANNPVVVRLGNAYSPAAVRLSAGQQFLVTVSPDVRATQDGVPDPCTPGVTVPTGSALLTARCAPDGVLYTAVRAGSATLSAAVGPRCSPGTMCAQWRAQATLDVTIT